MKTAIAIVLLALFGGAALMVAGGAAMAQSLVPGASAAPGRFEMQPVEGGIARLDTETGEVSLCRIEATKMTCQQSEEDRARLEARIRELSGNAAPRGLGTVVPGRPPAPDATAEAAREDAEIDRALGQMKRIFRTFRDITREFDEAPPQAEGGPSRT